ncbi:hypothetical protein TNCT_282061 [Trichonephila clavata]|uniref:Uncharacterized protein n=1 Tax=Trichonephila clavata TaxID=2740835 RepID=A0A8X6FZ03_TRICU|nr:hypothetical protein TNCT_282061 [Trichonephila clavata]
MKLIWQLRYVRLRSKADGKKTTRSSFKLLEKKDAFHASYYDPKLLPAVTTDEKEFAAHGRGLNPWISLKDILEKGCRTDMEMSQVQSEKRNI